MFTSTKLDALTQTLFNAIPESIGSIKNDLKQEFKAILLAAFNELDLVTHEEFDVQTKVLARTREKVESLIKQIETIEQSNK